MVVICRKVPPMLVCQVQLPLPEKEEWIRSKKQQESSSQNIHHSTVFFFSILPFVQYLSGPKVLQFMRASQR